MFNGIPLEMRKNDKTVKFWLFYDGTYRILQPSGWSAVFPDFAQKYIELCEAGFEEVIC